jgi:hypothetical protein
LQLLLHLQHPLLLLLQHLQKKKKAKGKSKHSNYQTKARIFFGKVQDDAGFFISELAGINADLYYEISDRWFGKSR